MDIQLIEDVIKYFFSASTVAAAIVYVSKKVFDTYISTRLEKAKNKLKHQINKDERQREELNKWANPVMASVNGLVGRLNHMVNDSGYQKLKDDTEKYYHQSTLYYFAQYLCWIQILKEEINYEIFSKKEKEQKFFTSLRAVNVSLRCTESPAPIFSLQQRHIAEIMMTESYGRRTCITYNKFIDNLEDEQTFKDVLIPLINLIEELKKPSMYTETILKAIQQLQNECQSLLKA